MQDVEGLGPFSDLMLGVAQTRASRRVPVPVRPRPVQDSAHLMITAIRRAVTSRVGAIIGLIFLGVVGLSFAMTDVSNLGFGGTNVGAGNVAKVGGEAITINDVRSRFNNALRQAQQEQPGLTPAAFIAQGGLDDVIKELTDISALEQYARSIGLEMDRAAVDALIARDPAFAGITGTFDQQTFEARIAQEGKSASEVREEVAARAIVRQLLAPIGQVTAIPTGMTVPYGSLLLEQRFGEASFIPASRFAPTAAPTDAQLQAYYTSQRARYTLPERRSIRFAILDQGAVRTSPEPTAAEIEAEYRANAARFAASETRRLSQVIAGSREAAQRIATAARTGTLASAAQAAGLQAATVTATSQADYATGTSAATAQAVFAASEGAVVGPNQVALGWVVVKVEDITSQPARTLAQATPELATQLRERQRREALDDLYNGAQEALAEGAALTEVAEARGLRVVSTPALTAQGLNPDDPSYRPDPLLPALLDPAFATQEGDPGQIVPLQENEVFALVEVAQIIPSAPPPLARIRERVVADWRQAEGAKVARARARQMLAAVEGGQALQAAATAAGVPGSVQTISGRRIDVARAQGRVPAEISLLFSMAPNTVKTLEMPGNTGWMVLRLNRIVRGDATGNPDLLAAVEQQFGQAIGGEYLEVILGTARREFEIQIDEEAVQRLRDELSGVATAGL